VLSWQVGLALCCGVGAGAGSHAARASAAAGCAAPVPHAPLPPAADGHLQAAASPFLGNILKKIKSRRCY